MECGCEDVWSEECEDVWSGEHVECEDVWSEGVWSVRM